MSKRAKHTRTPFDVRILGTGETSSVWIERGSKEELRYGGKVYDTNVRRAETTAKALFKRLEKFAKSLNEGRTVVRGKK